MTNHEAEWKEEPDYYGVMSDSKEVDSDVREGRGREALVDASFEYFINNVENAVRLKKDITNVPKESAYDAADMDGQADDHWGPR